MQETQSLNNLLLEQFPFLSQEGLHWLSTNGIQQDYENKEPIISAGQKPNELYFIVEGGVRGYDINEDGEERTFFIPPTRSFFSSPEILQKPKSTKYNFESVGRSKLFSIPFQKLKKDLLVLGSLSRLYIVAMEGLVSTLITRIEMLAGKGPEERYATLMDQYPEIFQNAPHKYIANYLGMTPNSLSRIIKRKKQGKT